MRWGFSFIFVCSLLLSRAQQIQLMPSGVNTSIRGLSVVNDRIIWASGTKGMVGSSTDSGKTWNWITVRGFEQTDFRDIEAFDETSAVIMGVGSPAYILRTSDAGSSWKVVYENRDTAMFLDAMHFWNELSGIVIGDPVNGKLFVGRSFDGGFSWKAIAPELLPKADSGEAFFASSGTNVRALNLQEALFVTGGKRSRVFIRDYSIALPILQGKESTGANSIAVANPKKWIITGGDFMQRDSTNGNCIITRNGGISWEVPSEPPHGYRSCVEFIKKNIWITCGLNGVDLCIDDGKNWKLISTTGFHVCRKAKKGNSVFLAGGNGRIGKLIW